MSAIPSPYQIFKKQRKDLQYWQKVTTPEGRLVILFQSPELLALAPAKKHPINDLAQKIRTPKIRDPKDPRRPPEGVYISSVSLSPKPRCPIQDKYLAFVMSPEIFDTSPPETIQQISTIMFGKPSFLTAANVATIKECTDAGTMHLDASIVDNLETHTNTLRYAQNKKKDLDLLKSFRALSNDRNNWRLATEAADRLTFLFQKPSSLNDEAIENLARILNSKKKPEGFGVMSIISKKSPSDSTKYLRINMNPALFNKEGKKLREEISSYLFNKDLFLEELKDSLERAPLEAGAAGGGSAGGGSAAPGDHQSSDPKEDLDLLKLFRELSNYRNNWRLVKEPYGRLAFLFQQPGSLDDQAIENLVRILNSEKKPEGLRVLHMISKKFTPDLKKYLRIEMDPALFNEEGKKLREEISSYLFNKDLFLEKLKYLLERAPLEAGAAGGGSAGGSKKRARGFEVAEADDEASKKQRESSGSTAIFDAHRKMGPHSSCPPEDSSDMPGFPSGR